ncbi:hypothetical protein ABRZ04_04325 [Castellaniella ginsengisoli]|uniref:Uncharacterized protein n=1 Tax=Castellaniella ginsengisoli TaxID=546114 RepID=A0AB39D2L4_9BURK
MQQAINPRFVLARRRAQRLDHPVYESPAYIRKSLTPKVQIGILRDPAKPIELSPALHIPKRPAGLDWHDVVGIVSAIGFVSLFFIGD